MILNAERRNEISWILDQAELRRSGYSRTTRVHELIMSGSDLIRDSEQQIKEAHAQLARKLENQKITCPTIEELREFARQLSELA